LPKLLITLDGTRSTRSADLAIAVVPNADDLPCRHDHSNERLRGPSLLAIDCSIRGYNKDSATCFGARDDDSSSSRQLLIVC
jgi:hypothetical protein